jgi:hypothetical protein
MLVTHQLNLCSRVLFGKLTVAQLATECPAFYRTKYFITLSNTEWRVNILNLSLSDFVLSLSGLIVLNIERCIKWNFSVWKMRNVYLLQSPFLRYAVRTSRKVRKFLFTNSKKSTWTLTKTRISWVLGLYLSIDLSNRPRPLSSKPIPVLYS